MQIQKKGAQKVVRKAFVLIVSVCVLLFTACGQKPVNSEEVSSPQEPSVERKNSILTEGGDDLPAAGTEVTAQTAPENATEETAATSSGKATSADAASQRTSKQAPVAPHAYGGHSLRDCPRQDGLCGAGAFSGTGPYA